VEQLGEFDGSCNGQQSAAALECCSANRHWSRQ
jgi:hypothetical protein